MAETKKNVQLSEVEKQDLIDDLIRQNGGVPFSDVIKDFCENKISGKGELGLGGRSLEIDTNEKQATAPGPFGGKLL